MWRAGRDCKKRRAERREKGQYSVPLTRVTFSAAGEDRGRSRGVENVPQALLSIGHCCFELSVASHFIKQCM